MRRLVVLSAVALALSVWTGAAFADQGPGRGGSHRGSFMSPFMLRSLGLTDAQRAQVRQIVANHRPRFHELNRDLRDTRLQLSDRLVAPGAVQPGELAPLTQRIGQLREQLSAESLQVALEIRSILTPDQLTKAADVRRRMQELRKEMRQLVGEGA
jgi:periplasmic protein CpxP/Spy